MPKKVLIVEDDSNIAELLHLYLEKEGFETKVAKEIGQSGTGTEDRFESPDEAKDIQGWHRILRSKSNVLLLSGRNCIRTRVQDMERHYDGLHG